MLSLMIEPSDLLALAGVLVVGILGFVNARWAANRAAQNSEKALARTIEADRAARLLERRIDLYADLLTFVAERRENRAVHMTFVKINGIEQSDPYKPDAIFALTSRAHAVADASVLAAFTVSNDAASATFRAWNYLQIAEGDPEWGKRAEEAIALKKAADDADDAFGVAVRAALQND